MSHVVRSEVKILSIGAAVQDVFLQGKIFTPKKEADGYVEEFKLGTKNDIEAVTLSTGGGATNAAVTFARQGFDTMYMGKLGRDVAGQAVLDDLHKEQIDTSLVSFFKDIGTGYSCILLAPNGERTVLTYRGASNHIDFQVSDFHGCKPDWMFLTSMAGNFEGLERVLNYAESNHIKVAMIPGKGELQSAARFRKLLPKLELIAANKEELALIYDGHTLEDLVKQANKDIHYVVGTDGPKGAVAADRWHIVKAGMYDDVRVVDRNGAGDAFASGFVAMIAGGEILEKAVVFASANSTSVVSQIGAKTGILHRHAHLNDMPLEVKEI